MPQVVSEARIEYKTSPSGEEKVTLLPSIGNTLSENWMEGTTLSRLSFEWRPALGYVNKASGFLVSSSRTLNVMISSEAKPTKKLAGTTSL
jgi:hypothetical protein